MERLGEPNPKSTERFCRFKTWLARQNSEVSYPNSKNVSASLLRQKFSHKQCQIVATDPIGNWVSHLVARVSPTLTDQENRPLGMLGFFESVNSPEAVQQILTNAIQWLNEQNCHSIVGPIDGDTWHAYRFNVGPVEEPASLSEPANPAYYPELWQAAGFESAAGYHSKVVDDISAIIPVVKTAYDAAVSKGYSFRTIELANFDAELEVLYRLSVESFDQNFLYDPISLDEFKTLYVDAKPLVDQDLVWIATDATGNDVGFLFCIVDYSEAIRAMQGKSNLLAKLKFALNRRRAAAVNFKSICVTPDHRRSSVAAALMHQGYVAAVAKGFRRANLCLIRDGNPSTKLDGGQSRLLRRYELYMTPNSNLKIS